MYEDPIRVIHTLQALAILFVAAGVYGILIRKEKIHPRSIYLNWGVILGAVFGGATGLILSALNGYPGATPLGGLYGIALGAWVGIALEVRLRKNYR